MFVLSNSAFSSNGCLQEQCMSESPSAQPTSQPQPMQGLFAQCTCLQHCFHFLPFFYVSGCKAKMSEMFAKIAASKGPPAVNRCLIRILSLHTFYFHFCSTSPIYKTLMHLSHFAGLDLVSIFHPDLANSGNDLKKIQ